MADLPIPAAEAVEPSQLATLLAALDRPFDVGLVEEFSRAVTPDLMANLVGLTIGLAMVFGMFLAFMGFRVVLPPLLPRGVAVAMACLVAASLCGFADLSVLVVASPMLLQGAYTLGMVPGSIASAALRRTAEPPGMVDQVTLGVLRAEVAKATDEAARQMSPAALALANARLRSPGTYLRERVQAATTPGAALAVLAEAADPARTTLYEEFSCWVREERRPWAALALCAIPAALLALLPWFITVTALAAFAAALMHGERLRKLSDAARAAS